jgi:hypothetical protein
MELVTKITWASLTMLIPTDIPFMIISPIQLLTRMILHLTTLLNHPQFQERVVWLKDIGFLKCKIDRDTNKELDTITHRESSLLLTDTNIILLKTEMLPLEEPHKTQVLRLS